MKRKVIDLTYTMENQMKVFPGDPPVGILPHHKYQNGYFVNQLIFGSHSGTHVDAPIHRIPGTESLTDLKIEDYIGWRTAVLDFSGKTKDITKEDCVKYEEKLKICDAVIFKTGWGDKAGTDEYFENYPGLTVEVAELLDRYKIHFIGVETPSVHPLKHKEIHVEFLKRRILIAEGLVNVNKITQQIVEFYAVPLKLKKADGSPVRAYVIEEQIG